MANVTNKTRAGRYGKTLQCPHCGRQTHVGNFAFSGLGCGRIAPDGAVLEGCGAMVEKCDWLLPDKKAPRA